jgi:hypothetical protein
MGTVRRSTSTGRIHRIPLLPTRDIEVQLVDENGRPRAGKARLTLPDGKVVEADLDANGWVRASRFPPGECMLEYPLGRDGRAPREGVTAVDAILHDAQGEPLRNRPFRARFADGSVRDGTTTAEGRAFLPAAPPGPFELEEAPVPALPTSDPGGL